MKPTLSLPFLSLATALISSTALAGTVQIDGKDAKTIIPPAAKPPIEINFKAETDYVGSGDFRYKPAGDQDAFHAHVEAGVSIPLTEKLYYTFNGFYDRYDFGTSLAPVPTTLHKLGAELAFEYRVDGETAIALIASPGIYGSEINSDSFNVPITAYGSYRLSSSVVAVVGARYDQWSMYQFLPSGGIIWTINDQWKLRAIASSPRIEYTPNENITYSFGGELTGGTYRTAESEQNYPAKHLDYYDIRAGAGVTYRGWKPLAINVTAGWSFERNFRYDDIDTEYRVKGAPYVAVSAKATF